MERVGPEEGGTDLAGPAAQVPQVAEIAGPPIAFTPQTVQMPPYPESRSLSEHLSGIEARTRAHNHGRLDLDLVLPGVQAQDALVISETQPIRERQAGRALIAPETQVTFRFMRSPVFGANLEAVFGVLAARRDGYTKP